MLISVATWGEQILGKDICTTTPTFTATVSTYIGWRGEKGKDVNFTLLREPSKTDPAVQLLLEFFSASISSCKLSLLRKKKRGF